KPWDEFDLKLKIKSLLKISHLEKEKERLLLLTHSQNKKLRDWNKELEVKVADRVSELKQTEGMLDEAYKELSSSYESVIKLLSHAMSTKEYMLTKDYPELPILVQQLATKAGFSEYIVRQTYFSAMLFELGKLAMPEQLLATPQSQLTPEELDKLLAYTTIGASVLADIPNFNETAQIIEKHCEYIDGSGAPNQLALEEIPVGSKVLAIVKDYFLLQSGRFDGKRYCNKKAVDYLLAEAGNKYDEKLVNIFADIVSEVEQSDSQNKERKLSTKALRSGMVLSRDCSNGQGLLLLNKGKLLTNESIKKLIAFEKVYDVPLTYHVFS
ncbi:MAG: hypothetical protein KUG78_19580, partial [Kangiellaceae bacterium]|nr:hypothetical protein [Kangiellaceae bacterium]